MVSLILVDKRHSMKPVAGLYSFVANLTFAHKVPGRNVCVSRSPQCLLFCWNLSLALLARFLWCPLRPMAQWFSQRAAQGVRRWPYDDGRCLLLIFSNYLLWMLYDSIAGRHRTATFPSQFVPTKCRGEFNSTPLIRDEDIQGMRHVPWLFHRTPETM